MNFGLRKMQMSSAAVPPKRIRPISAPARRRARAPAHRAHAREAPIRHRAPRPRARARRRASPSRAPCRRARSSVRSSSAAAGRVRAPRATRPRTPRAHLGRQRAHGHEQRPPRARAACSPISRCRRGPRRAQLEHVAEHRHAPPGGRLGEVVDRGAHGHRVGVVAVVDQDHLAGRARAARRAAPRSAPPRCRSGSTPSAARRGDGREQVAQVVRLREGRPSVISSRSRRLARSHRRLPPIGRGANHDLPPSERPPARRPRRRRT